MNAKWLAILIFGIITTISIVYAFVQTVKAQAAERQAVTEKNIAEEQRRVAVASGAEAARLQVLYVQCQKELANCQAK